MRRLRDWWERFWFEPTMPDNLGIARMLFFGGLFLIFVRHDFAAWGTVSPIFWDPVFIMRLFHLPQGSPEVIGALGVVWKAALFLACVGLFTRPATATAFLLGIYLLGLQHSFGKIRHHDAILLFAMGFLALSRCGDAWSLDRIVRGARNGTAVGKVRSGEYTWPVRAIWLTISIAFCAAGLAKLHGSGLEWIFSDNLANTLIEASYPIKNGPLVSWGLNLAQLGWLCVLLAGATIVVETGYPLAMISTRARWFFVPAMLSMQIGIRVIMGPRFVQFMLANIFWVPWDRVGAWARGWVRGGRSWTVLYDGGCGLCQRTVATLRELDLLRRVEFRDVLADWPEIQRRHPALRQDSCLDVMHAVSSDGTVTTGFYAYRALAWVIPLGWLVLPLLYLPGVPAIGNRVYAAVAARRHRSGCPLPAVDPPRIWEAPDGIRPASRGGGGQRKGGTKDGPVGSPTGPSRSRYGRPDSRTRPLNACPGPSARERRRRREAAHGPGASGPPPPVADPSRCRRPRRRSTPARRPRSASSRGSAPSRHP